MTVLLAFFVLVATGSGNSKQEKVKWRRAASYKKQA